MSDKLLGDIAAGNNPFQLTNAQVGTDVGYRLMDRSEFRDRHYPHKIFPHVQFRVSVDARWRQSDNGIYARLGFSKANCYRTRLTAQEVAIMDEEYDNQTRRPAGTHTP